MPSLAITCGKPVYKLVNGFGKNLLYSPAWHKFVVILRCFCEIFHTLVTLSAPSVHRLSHRQDLGQQSDKFELYPKTTSPITNTASYLYNFYLFNMGGQKLGGSLA